MTLTSSSISRPEIGMLFLGGPAFMPGVTHENREAVTDIIRNNKKIFLVAVFFISSLGRISSIMTLSFINCNSPATMALTFMMRRQVPPYLFCGKAGKPHSWGKGGGYS